MIKAIKNLKLKTQFIMLTTIFSILIIILGSFLYTNMARILNNKIDASTEQVFNHIEMELLKYIHDVEISANTIAYMQQVQDSISSKNDMDSYELYNSIRLSLNSVLLTNENIASVILDLKGINLAFNDISLNLDGLENIQLNSNNTYFSKLLSYSDVNSSKPLYYFAAVRRVNNVKSLTSTEYPGNIIFILSKSYLDDIASRYGTTKNSKIYIISNNNEVIGRLKDSADEETEKIILNQVPVAGTTSLLDVNGVEHIYQTRSVGDTGWRIASLTPYREYFEELNSSTAIIFILFIVVMLIMLVFSILIASNINSPVQKMLSAMKEIKRGNLKTRCDIELHNELGILSNHFNEMMDEINTLTHKIFGNQQKMYEMELANKDARFMALQSQINPHFLYNALACIQGIALHYEVDDIAKVSQALASIFRYSIKENNYVTISAEIENIKNYVLIYQIKSADDIDLHVDIEPEMYPLTVPKLLLQPIVENALIHGLTKKIGGGTLVIKGFKSQNILHFEFIDNGVGIPQEHLYELNKAIEDTLMPSEMEDNKRSIGIINIKQRLKLCYSGNYSFSVERTQDGGTRVIVEIPYEEDKSI